MRIPFAILLCGSLAAASGCNRSSDGTLQIRPVTLPAIPFGEWPSLRRKEPPPQQASTQFPNPPHQPAAQPSRATDAARRPATRSGARVSAPRIVVSAPFKPVADPSAKLSCRNETQASGRIKVVCE